MLIKTSIDAICEKVKSLKRITKDEAITLYNELDLIKLGQLAHELRLQKANPEIATYIVDRNINYTNICISHCEFCAFYKKLDDSEGYVLEDETIRQKILETKSLGGTGILLQGGLNPKLRLDFYRSLLKLIQTTADIHIHAFSPPEILYISQLEKMSIRDVLLVLIDSGLASIPGGGAEILVDSIRSKVSPKKYSSEQWLSVMESAHELGIKTTATMMFGHIESLNDRLEHLDKLRGLQDRTGGFTAFIPWTFQERNTNLSVKPIYSYDYLKTLSLSRIYLDNFQNIQGSWVTQGEDIGQLSLRFGANDLGSIMIEENVVKAAGTSFKISEKRMRRLIEEAGFTPFKRDTLYSNVPSSC